MAKTITEKLQESLSKESKKFSKKGSNLKESYSKFSKIGIELNPTYSLPMKDTIGKTFREQVQSNSLL